jgi:hypothetical protein
MKPLGALALSATIAGSMMIAQGPSPAPLREVRGQTIISNQVPKADLTFSKDFHYVGGQQVNLYGMAEAEQHVFAVAGSNGVVERFYWVQFEHRLPKDKHTYDYKGPTTNIGGFSFIYDVKSWPDYAANQLEDPASDGAAIARLLSDHSLAFPKKVVRVRMFYLPTPDRRTELMVIYGEALPDDSKVPMREGGVQLDTESPDSAHLFLEHARRDLGIVKK